MKKYIFIILIIALLFSVVFAEGEEETQRIIDEYIKIYGESIEDGVNDIKDTGVEDIFPGFSVQKLLGDAAKGNNLFSPDEIISRLLVLLLREIRKVLKLLVIVPVIAVINSYIVGMNKDFKTKGTTKAAFFVSYIVMSGVLSVAFIETVRCGQNTMENVAVFMRILVPVTLASLAASGAVVSATAFEIILVSVIEITELAIEKFFMPMVLMATALNIANNVSGSLNAEKLVKLLNQTVKWGLGVLLTLFVGIIGLQGVVAGSADGLTAKVTKFAASNLVPMVGGILAETVETVMNCSVVIKNAVGVVGIIAVIGILVVPVIKVSACLIMFRLLAALIQPISEECLVKCVTEFGDSVSQILGMLVAVLVLFVIILTIIINIGNAAVLLGR